MISEEQFMTIEDIAETNPRRFIAKASMAPFISMSALLPYNRDIDINDICDKVFSGGGSKFKNGDVLLARITPCLENGKTAIVSSLPEGSCGHGSTEFIVISARDKDDSNFLYYLVRSEDFRLYAISSMEGTSGRQRVPNSAVGRYEFLELSNAERKRIGSLLRDLDDGIALLQKTNTTLEKIAQALFKSWFVDFDPVKAKMEGRPPFGMDDATAALFPDSFEQSELGEIPKEWAISTVGQCYNLLMGQSPPGNTYNEDGEGLPFYQGRTDFSFRYPKKRVYCNSPTKIADKYDTLVSVRAPVGDVNLAREKCCIGRGVSAINHKGGATSYTYYSMHNLSQHFKQFEADGTVFGSINKKDFEGIKIVNPSRAIIDNFNQIISEIDLNIENNSSQIDTLSSLRDLLLPRLVSGKLRLNTDNLNTKSESLCAF